MARAAAAQASSALRERQDAVLPKRAVQRKQKWMAPSVASVQPPAAVLWAVQSAHSQQVVPKLRAFPQVQRLVLLSVLELVAGRRVKPPKRGEPLASV